MLGEDIQDRAAEILALCRARRIMLATAESCTGGLLAAALTSIAGSSDVFERGFVTYSNAAKHEMLGIDMGLIERHGAVSEEVATAMAQGALGQSLAGLAVSVTGIAGPEGGSAEKPIGLVYFACGTREGLLHAQRREFGSVGRTEIRLRSVAAALDLIERVAGLSS